MAMLLPLLLAAEATVFPGGSANDLVSHLSETRRANVIAAQAYVKPVPKFSYDATFELLARGIQKSSGLRVLPGGDLVLSDEVLLPIRMRSTSVGHDAPNPKWVELQAENLKERKVTFKTVGDERLDVGSLENAPFSKKVSVHWSLHKTPLAISVNAMDEQRFLTFAAKAAGGFLSITRDGYVIALDPQALRTRATNLLVLRKTADANSGYDQAEMLGLNEKIDIYVGILQSLPNGAITQAFRDPEASVSSMLGPQSAGAKRFMMAMARSKRADAVEGDPFSFRTPVGTLRLDRYGSLGIGLKASFDLTVLLPIEGTEGDLKVTFDLSIG
jgi:hypothetical protein